MRIDLPHELSRRPEPPAVAPLEPSPLEQRREQLHERREQRRMPEIPRPRRERSPWRPRPVSHDYSVERRQKRDRLPRQVIGVSLREEERRLLSDVSRFRVIATRDLAESIYGGHTRQMQQDLRYLREQGLVEVDAVRARRDGRGGRVERIEVVTLTKDGWSVARQTSGLPDNQKLYYGMVKPREVEHDTQIYRAYEKEADRIEESGGSNLRVKLDFELKSQVQKAIYAERKADPKCDMAEIKREVAEKSELPIVNGKIQIPDARIEYDLPRNPEEDIDQGSRTGHADIEVLTAAYPRLIRSGAVCDKMALNVDIAPTILELAGVKAPVGIQGRSLVPLLKGEEAPNWRKEWLYEYYDERFASKSRGVRTEKYKLIQYWAETPEEFELYDLEADPGELNNLYGDPHYAKVVEQLKNRIRQLRIETGDNGLHVDGGADAPAGLGALVTL